MNLYDYVKEKNFMGLNLNTIRKYTVQMLEALKVLKSHSIIHCDLKPENILLANSHKTLVKLIDFGSSCFSHEKIYTYIQSRFYRAPEVMLGISYTSAIDIWSLGCILAELATGFPIFPGESEAEQMILIMELIGVPSTKLLQVSSKHNF
jgi:dual specificity tyrosine-phosphorylation-regulated kinase 2/3/4